MSQPNATSSTADSWNRQRDKAYIETSLKLPEFAEMLREPEEYPKFYSLGVGGELVARGYHRVVYGDHGAYIECNKEQINWTVFVLNEGKAQSAPQRFYDEWFTVDKSVMLYDQLRGVQGQRNPPKDGKSTSAFRNREGGYADYKAEQVYVDPAQIRVVHYEAPKECVSSVADPAAGSVAPQPPKKSKKSRLQ